MTKEHFYSCPFCWAAISMVLDLSVQEQEYIEDCEVCCRPIRIRFRVAGEEIDSFEAIPVEQ